MPMDATNISDAVRQHYDGPGLTERLKAALASVASEDRPLTPQQLAPLDQFHTRGAEATIELGQLAGITAGASVLDVGSGIGGPARLLAQATGCRVTGVDLSPTFVDAARYLTGRTGQGGQISFQTGSALDLPFEDSHFDFVLLQHVAMNIPDRALLYREIHRVLKAGGRFATFDVVMAGGEPHYPVPWARTPQTSFLLSAEQTRQAIEAAGFRNLVWQDDTEAARSWFVRLRETGIPPLSPGLLMGPDFMPLMTNLARNLMEGRLAVLTAVFEA
jgi:SAM-dependent methyltransferase